MDREAAVEKATEIVEKMGNNPELNNRGYKVDGWKTPSVAERTEAIVKIAAFLVTPTGPLVAPHAPGECPGPPECM